MLKQDRWDQGKGSEARLKCDLDWPKAANRMTGWK